MLAVFGSYCFAIALDEDGLQRYEKNNRISRYIQGTWKRDDHESMNEKRESGEIYDNQDDDKEDEGDVGNDHQKKQTGMCPKWKRGGGNDDDNGDDGEDNNENTGGNGNNNKGKRC